MGGSGFFALLDDITTMTSKAAAKVAGVVGDDIAVTAETATGVTPARELSVVLKVAIGSAVNKMLLIGAGLALTAIPGAIPILLMLGGSYLSYEGIHKVRGWFPGHKPHKVEAVLDAGIDTGKPTLFEKGMKALSRAPGLRRFAGWMGDGRESRIVGGAIVTDTILSAEIIALTLGVVAGAPLLSSLVTLVGIGIAATIGVYGLVAGLVTIDDVGIALTKKNGKSLFAYGVRKLGRGIVKSVPLILKTVSVAGTVAMFAVGGGIIAHGIPALAGIMHIIEALPFGGMAGLAATIGLGGLTGLLVDAGTTQGARLMRVFGGKKKTAALAHVAESVTPTAVRISLAPVEKAAPQPTPQQDNLPPSLHAAVARTHGQTQKPQP